MLSVEFSVFEARDLGPNQGDAIFKILRAVSRPEPELVVMYPDDVELMSEAGIAFADGSFGKRTLKVVFCRFEL